MAWFAREPDGSPLRPEHWRRACMATVGTHDVAPIAGFVSGDQVSVRSKLGLLHDPQAERQASAAMLASWRDALVARHLLPPFARDQIPLAEQFTVAMYGYLALTPARLVGVSLADAVGDRRPQNIPGTFDEYPNWRVPLCDGEGRAVLIEDLPDSELLRSVAGAARHVPGSAAT
jgi:4-alpha-glucanotransferase